MSVQVSISHGPLVSAVTASLTVCWWCPSAALLRSCMSVSALTCALVPLNHPPAQLGRFTLRDEGKTIAIGKVLRVPKRGGGGTQAE